MSFVLLVDDDTDQLQLRRILFERDGHRVASACGAAEALRLFTDHPVDLVLMDLCLPRADDGRALIRKLRELSTTVRIMVLSGWPHDLQDAPEAKLIDGCLRKPVRSAQVLRAVKRISGS